MSVKRTLILAAAGVASLAMTAALAGGPEAAPEPAPVTGVYIQGDVGYVQHNWEDYLNAPAATIRNGEGSIVFGGAVGYQWSRYLAAELGAFYVPVVRIPASARITSWFAYAAAKLIAPVPFVDNLEVFAKAGVAYRDLHITSGATSINPDQWRPIFGAGVMYRFNPSWYVKLQWLHVPAGKVIAGSGLHVPAYNLYLFGAGYMFSF